MKIERVNNKYLATTFKTILFIVVLVIITQVVYSIKFARTEEKRQAKDLNSTILSYQYNISEKLSILTSSNTFLDFLRSGELSRESKALDMNILFSNFKDKTISGITIYKSNGSEIFNYGEDSEMQLTLKLCYLNDFLDPDLGSCRHQIRINFEPAQLVARLQTMNPNIISCESCKIPFEISKDRIGSFNSSFSKNMVLPISLAPTETFGNIIYFEFFSLMILLVIFYLVHRSFGKISQDFIYNPIKEIASGLSSGEPIDLSKVSIFEIKFLGEAINNFILNTRDQEELRRSASLGQMATQVAHDIRSPLEMLKGLKEEIAPLPEKSRRKIQLSINRIEEITFHLLKTHKKSNQQIDHNQSEELLSLVTCVVSEKNIEFRNNTHASIVETLDSSSYGMFSNFHRSSLKSILSNLVNNSIESFSESGTVEIRLTNNGHKNIINVTDTGPGIPKEFQERVFTKGFTTKKYGNGIGLFNAKSDIEAAGGTISFESEVGKGTTFTISLPKSEAPVSFVASIDAYKYERIIVLDDDPAFHEVWSKRLEGLESKVEHIHSVEEMFFKYQALHPKILLLSDFELMDKQMDGIDTILKLGHSEHSILVTARNEEQAIQDRCLAAGIKLLPKSLVNYVKVSKELSESSQAQLGIASMVGDGSDDRLFTGCDVDRHKQERLSAMPMSTGREGIGDGQFGEPSGSSKHIDASKLGDAYMVGDTMLVGAGSGPEVLNSLGQAKLDQVEGSQGRAEEAYNKYAASGEIRSGDVQIGSNLIVLIDDDRLVHLNWASHCKKNGLPFQGFKSIDDFLKVASSSDKASKIYIDSNLGDGIKGEIESEKIFALGFLNLYLATGYEKDSIQKPKWIKEIFSKSPENIV